MTPVITPTMRLDAWIFDVDGVLLDSPHERAWHDALSGIADPARFTSAVYQAHVAGRSRQDGALAALIALGVSDAKHRAETYARAKQRCLEDLIASEGVVAYPDALRFVRKLMAGGWPLAAASSSKNAEGMMRGVELGPQGTLFDVFSVTVCGRDLRRGKPDPEIFLLAALELGVDPTRCIVVEDAPAGIQAAVAGGMASLGVARRLDTEGLRAAGAAIVVTSLDEIRVPERSAFTPRSARA